MATTPITVTQKQRDGRVLNTPVAHTEAASVAGTDGTNCNTIANTGRELLIVRAATGTPTVKLLDKNGVQVGSTLTTVNGKTYVFGPFPVSIYGSTVSVIISTTGANCVVTQLNGPHAISL